MQPSLRHLSLSALAVIFCSSQLAVAQRNAQPPDDLHWQQIRGSSDTTAIRLLEELADKYLNTDPSRSISYVDSAIHRAQKINDPQRIAATTLHKGRLYRLQNEYRKAGSVLAPVFSSLDERSPLRADAALELGITLLRLSARDSAMTVLKQGQSVLAHHPDTYLEASLLNSMGNVLREKNDYQQALEHYIRSARLFEKIHHNAGLTQALSNIGNIHNLMDDTDKALEYAQQSLDVAKAARVKSSIAYSYRLLGRIYRKQKKTDEAVAMYTQAITLYRELSATRDLGETLLAMANIYYDKRAFDLATQQYKASIGVARSLGDSSMMTFDYSGLSYTMLEQKKYHQALRYIDTTLWLAAKMNIPTIRMDAFQVRSIVHEELNDHKAALADYRHYVALHDSITDVQNRTATREVEARYQTEKKDDAIRLLNAENELKAEQLRAKNNLRNYLVLLLALSALVIAVTYNRYKVKLRANKKLKELDEMKSRFFTNVSHEFRTPLSLILGPLQEKLKDGAGETGNTALMYRNAKRLQDLINQLLDLSRIEAGSLQLHLVEGDLSSLLTFIGGTFTSMADHQSIAYTVDVLQTPYIGCYDRDKLEKILYNLLSNAFKFTPEGGAIHFHARVEKDVLQVEVRDSGRGIPADKLALIFTRFYRVDESDTRAADGSGIGLALAKELAELHRGKITVTSEEGMGSTFTLMLPVHRKAFAGMTVTPDAPATGQMFHPDHDNVLPEPPFEAVHDGKPLVLVAEDHHDMQGFIRQRLQEHYTVVTAGDGLEALEKAQTLVPDLVVTDWMMPGMDGRTLCEKLKTAEATCHIPVLMLTAKADHPSKLEGLETGADDYLTKPFDTQELLVRIRNILSQRERLRKIFSTQLVLTPDEVPLASRDAAFLKNVMAYLEEKHSSPEFGVEAFAAKFNMSRMQLHRKMKALTDQSPGDFLRRFRLERAKQLLMAEQGVQVSEVCFRVGFSNVANFSKAFREHTGMTPSQFLNLSV